VVAATDLSLSLPTKLAVGLGLKDVPCESAFWIPQFTPWVVPPFPDSVQRLGDKNYSIVCDQTTVAGFLYHESNSLSSKFGYICIVLYSYSNGNVQELYAVVTIRLQQRQDAAGAKFVPVGGDKFINLSYLTGKKQPPRVFGGCILASGIIVQTLDLS
jgi:hypothetical protein